MRALIAVLLLACPALAQKPPEKPTRIPKSPVAVPGYTPYKIQGFTVFVGGDVLAVPEKTYARMPLDVLDGELGTVAAVMDRKSVDALRRLVIWAEWNDTREGEAGRGVPVALYRSGTAQTMVRRDLHPLKAKTVDVVNLKALTEEHQPGRDSGRCVLLHEFAHAVHDQVVGWENPAIKGAFAQAMERRLYDKGQYVTTSPAEFFAELTCSYLDRLNYYPATRDDLKKHDSATYKLMEKVWGPGVRKPPPPPARGGAMGDPSLKLTSLRYGSPVVGDAIKPESLAGQVVLIVWYGGDQANALDRAALMRAELGDYGLTVIGATALQRATDAEVRAEAERRGPGCLVARGVYVPTDDGSKLFNQRAPAAFVFDPTGVCVHKGTVFASEKEVRAAVGAKLLAEACPGGEVPTLLKPVADAFAAGTAPIAALAKLTPVIKSQDAPAREAAERLRAAILKPVVAEYEAATRGEATDPAAAFIAAERVAAVAKGLPEGAKAQALADRLRKTKPVVAELKARAALVPIAKLAGLLRGQEGSYDAKSARFRSRNAAALVQLQRMTDEFRAKHAGTKAMANLDTEVGEFGL